MESSKYNSSINEDTRDSPRDSTKRSNAVTLSPKREDLKVEQRISIQEKRFQNMGNILNLQKKRNSKSVLTMNKVFKSGTKIELN